MLTAFLPGPAKIIRCEPRNWIVYVIFWITIHPSAEQTPTIYIGNTNSIQVF